MSNLSKRVIVGAIAIPLILYITYSGGNVFFFFTLIASSIALIEFFSLFEKKGFQLNKIFLLILSVIAYVVLYYNLFDGLTVFIIFILLIFTFEIFNKEHNPVNAFLGVGGFVYIMIPFLLLNSLTGIKINDSGINVVIILFVLIWICDSAAYFGGKGYGKKQLSKISPKKTIEGSVTGFIVTFIVSIILYFALSGYFTLTDFIMIGILTGIFSQVGDLFESMIKRYCGVKDSSGIIPGHGGVLDRFDSIIFMSPVIYAYLNLFSS
jgi:phosphatidate cytidylyltransferase